MKVVEDAVQENRTAEKNAVGKKTVDSACIIVVATRIVLIQYILEPEHPIVVEIALSLAARQGVLKGCSRYGVMDEAARQRKTLLALLRLLREQSQ